jgi:hypothetical protein
MIIEFQAFAKDVTHYFFLSFAMEMRRNKMKLFMVFQEYIHLHIIESISLFSLHAKE